MARSAYWRIPALIACTPLLADATAAALPPEGQLIRGIYARPEAAVDSRTWSTWGQGYEFDGAEKHSGSASIRCSNPTDAVAHGASQRITLNQTEARPIIVAGWAKLERVSGPPDYHCSVYLDLRLKNGESWPMKIAAFDPAKTGWQYSEAVHSPPAPIDTAAVYVFLRERTGTAWFDDIYVGELIEGERRSENLLESPGFEDAGEARAELRDEFFNALSEINCNAVHIYRSVPWDTAMAGQEVPPLEQDDPFLDFVADAHRRGCKVWVTVGLGLPSVTGPDSPDFPVWGCVNNRWGEAYTRAVAYLAQYGVDGVGVVPDEWNYNTHPVAGLAKHKDPQVAEFYASLPPWCRCPICQERFRQAYGREYPDVAQAWQTGDPVWAQFTKFRYDSTTDWIARTVQAAKAVNRGVVTDTMICVLPVCSDNRLHTGAAWDQIGRQTALDCLQTDPYLLLHNYLGDSTHLYPTETTLHLAAANFARRNGVTLESCRLRDTYREKDPVEVYGAALSCWLHGAGEFFWWHMNYIIGAADYVDPERPKAGVRSAYQVMQAMEPYLAEGEVPGEVLVCYSRRSEDTWDWLSRADAADRVGHNGIGAKRGFIAHRNVLYALLRRGCPFRMTFLENPDPDRLTEAKAILVPFPFALSESEVALLGQQADAGKTVIVMSELSPVDEWGQPRERPALADLVGQPANLDAMQPVSRTLGKGEVIFIGGDLAANLFETIPAEKNPTQRVPLPPFQDGRWQQLETAIDAALGRRASLFAGVPGQDVEAGWLVSPRAYVLLAINWDVESPADGVLRLPVADRAWEVEGRRILPGGKVERVDQSLAGNRVHLTLQPQEARLLALRR